ncbi:zinc finger, CCHC-type containing protein [Tanacetum coccineum]
MSTYLKNMGGYKHNQLKNKSYKEIQKMFNNEMRRVNTFIPMDYEVVKSKKGTEESSKGAKDELKVDKSKKAKSSEEKAKSSRKKMLVIVKDDEIAIDVIPLATKPPMIVEYKLLKEGIMVEDLETLWKLVKIKHADTRPEDEHERVLLGDLKVMFEPNIRSEVWRNLQGYTVNVWKLIGINKWYQSFALRNFDLEDMEFESTNSNTTAKLPILKLVLVDLTKEFLSLKLSMKDIGEANVILGIRIKHESNKIAISQSYYIEKVLKKFNYFDCTPVSTPMATSEKLIPNNGQAVSQLDSSRVIGCLMYVMTCTRPDIAFAVGKLSRYTSNYGTQHWQAIQQISNAKDTSSTSGWVFLLGGGAIFGLLRSRLASLGGIYKVLRTQRNLADHLTKGLARDLVLKSAEGIGSICFGSYNIYELDMDTWLV